MKKLLLLLTVATITLASIQTSAQAFDKNTKLLTLALGPGEMIHFIGNNGYYGASSNVNYVTGQLSFQGEFAVHKYIGVGFVVGLGGRASSLVWPSEVNIPIGVLSNFHFFQLIADKNGLALGDKLDVYAGITVGSGAFIWPNINNNYLGSSSSYSGALFYFGPHAGVNYYFAKNIAVHGEVGWGVTVIQAGITFKLGGGNGGSSKGK